MSNQASCSQINIWQHEGSAVVKGSWNSTGSSYQMHPHMYICAYRLRWPCQEVLVLLAGGNSSGPAAAAGALADRRYLQGPCQHRHQHWHWRVHQQQLTQDL